MRAEALYKQDFLVLSNEADIHHKASLYSISNYLQEAARSHADKLGWGVEWLRSRKQFWVLTRMLIQVDHFPSPGHRLTVQTWPKGTDRLFALRDFLIEFEGDIIARATSSWALLDLQSRRPTSLAAMDERMFERAGIHAIEHVPEKLPAPERTASAFSHQVTYSELDLNGHVNNTRYINWMLDTFPLAYHEKHTVKEAQLNYLAEVFPDQTITINRQEIAADKFLFQVSNDKGIALFRGLISFS